MTGLKLINFLCIIILMLFLSVPLILPDDKKQIASGLNSTGTIDKDSIIVFDDITSSSLSSEKIDIDQKEKEAIDNKKDLMIFRGAPKGVLIRKGAIPLEDP